MESNPPPSQYDSFRKKVKVFALVNTFITILLVHLSVVSGIYIVVKSRSGSITGGLILEGVIVMVWGLLVSVFWRFMAKLATEAMLILADIADGLSPRREGLTKRVHGTRQNLQG
jgi:hypothetical protein